MTRLTHALFGLGGLLLIGCGPSDRALEIADMAGDTEAGRTLFQANCQRCHGSDAKGGSGPNLVSAAKNLDEAEIAEMILSGGWGMPEFDHLGDQEIADLVVFVEGL